MKRQVKARVDNKSTENERISNSQTTILEDFMRLKELVDIHYKIKKDKYVGK